MKTRFLTLALVSAVAATSASSVAAQTRKPAKPGAAPATLPGPPPEVSVVGLRIIGAGLGKNREEIRAFNERPGVALALAIRRPAGHGIVELDEDKCILTSVTDDAGTDLGEQAEYGSFPKASDDGSVGMIEIESRLRPAPAATAIMAEGTLVFSASPGSKPTKIAGLKLEKGRTFKLGTSTVTLAEVTPGEDTTIELALPRSALSMIRDVKFTDATGNPLEADRTSRGYMNEDASIGYRIKGAGPTVAIEFDMWQGLREQKVPFKIKTGLALK